MKFSWKHLYLLLCGQNKVSILLFDEKTFDKTRHLSSSSMFYVIFCSIQKGELLKRFLIMVKVNWYYKFNMIKGWKRTPYKILKEKEKDSSSQEQRRTFLSSFSCCFFSHSLQVLHKDLLIYLLKKQTVNFILKIFLSFSFLLILRTKVLWKLKTIKKNILFVLKNVKSVSL